MRPATTTVADAHSGPFADKDTPTPKQPTGSEPICAGDTIIYHDVLPAALEAGVYERLRDEVQWQRMSHQGGEVPRLVCAQGAVAGDAMPVYRHPADESPPLEPFTPTVLRIKQHVEALAGHALNHVLIQHYRSGDDYISEHSDKTLDIVPGSFICNMSVGAERTMIFRTKRPDKSPSSRTAEGIDGGGDKEKEPDNDDAAATKRQSCRVQLPHNSLCRMGLETNKKWLHAIRQDKRAVRDKTEPELAFGGRRISLTFRQIGTFLNKSATLIWGQGAVAKTRAEARPVTNGLGDEAIAMLRAFGAENHSASFDWAHHYGRGFDVLHMSSAPRFFASSDALVDATVQLFLAELGINYAKGSIGGGTGTTAPRGQVRGDATAKPTDAKQGQLETAGPPSSLAVAVRFVDNDHDRSTVDGLLAILLYLDSVYHGAPASSPPSRQRAPRCNAEAAQIYTRLQQALVLQDRWRPTRLAAAAESASHPSATGAAFSLTPWAGSLAAWNAFVSPASHSSKSKDVSDDVLFIAGGASPTLADFAFWPVLHSMEQALGTATADVKQPPPQTPPSALATELERLGMSPLARYYVQLKVRESFGRVILTREKQR